MAGLLSKDYPREGGSPGQSMAGDAMGPGAPASPMEDAPTAGPGAGEEQPNVSPEEQKEYEQFIDNALSLVYDDKVLPTVLQRLSGGGDPIEGLAAATVLIVDRLEDSAKKAGRQISPDVLMHGGKEILEDLANLAEQAKIHTFTPEEAEGAYYRALDLYRAMKSQSGELDTEGLKQDFSQIVQADQSGQLEELAPGLAEHFAGSGGPGGGEEQVAPRQNGQDTRSGGERRPPMRK